METYIRKLTWVYATVTTFLMYARSQWVNDGTLIASVILPVMIGAVGSFFTTYLDKHDYVSIGGTIILCCAAAVKDPGWKLALYINGSLFEIVWKYYYKVMDNTDCTDQFLQSCWASFYCDLTYLFIIVSAFLTFYNALSTLLLIVAIVTLCVGLFLINILDFCRPTGRTSNNLDNSEQQALFGINDEDI